MAREAWSRVAPELSEPSDGGRGLLNRLAAHVTQGTGFGRARRRLERGVGRRLEPWVPGSKVEASDIRSRVCFRTEPTAGEVANKLEELAMQLRFSTESATRLEIARALVHLAGHTYALAGTSLGEPADNVSMPTVEVTGE